jgi:NADH-quinone oxidoreductase subunit I
MRHVFERKVTVQYPDEAPAMGYRFRGRHIFHQDVCIGCTQCERVCPVIAIKMEEHKDPGTRKVVVDRFAVDLGICYYCGLCEEVCPTDPKAVHLGPDFELATHDRRLLIYEMDQLVGPKPLPSKPEAVPAAPAGDKPAVATAEKPAVEAKPASDGEPQQPAATGAKPAEAAPGVDGPRSPTAPGDTPAQPGEDAATAAEPKTAPEPRAADGGETPAGTPKPAPEPPREGGAGEPGGESHSGPGEAKPE